ncbi:histidinol dehydrogenase [Prodigiosinella confusarubida]|uniref:Histidinol dehydrogenase n=1 Tax=Serratia sp. (strain ATCC 39006) TaxID=104623 RepID=A0A2I5THR6_SERS3|nr:MULTISPECIES: histidinol dehydrogenase [Enterobacterales]WJV57355.1 histidinol dehydrogenase [Pectobacteriaceae bacterium C111]WJY15973.1 histidinol dehydrogenase [Pectobacteriaceae bacterium CE90]AUG99795.1 histidinol dehydrogenase [Serratia sp. ATCC 39006]AUH04114.1 histidinol dehydrogenase [Serratia sp. ATCC 39006]WJV53000.1 histidinol dehydrogenase [Prodigiosinella sp. LS101]
MKMAVTFHDLSASDTLPAELFKRTESDLSFFTERVVPIIAAVQQEGDAALIRFAREFDGVQPEHFAIRAEESEFDDAFARMDPEVIESIRFAVENVRAFHEAQKPEEMWLKEMQPGAFAGDRHVPIDAVACYVPRGKGSFPSVLVMTAVPAVVAGVPRAIVITPPGPDGKVDDATLVAARLVGITEIYKCGGAQGVAAVAYGTQSVPKCLKIVGPGSPWVVAAKRQLTHLLDPGVPAGPSESLILADDSVDGALAALDLLIESEHGPDSSAYLVTSSRRVAEQAIAALPGYWAQQTEKRAEFSQKVLGGDHGGVVLTRDFATAVEFVNQYAPEHLEILAAEPMAVMTKIRNAGEILLGNYTPITLGNFVLGPNAVLPTNGAAKTAGPLSVFDYMKRISIGYVTAAGYDPLAVKAKRFAEYEGFPGHALAVSDVRKRLLEGKNNA